MDPHNIRLASSPVWKSESRWRKMTRPLLPPRFVNLPAGLVYDQRLSPAVRDTYAQLRGLAWGRSELFDISMESLIELTGKSRATIYGHLAVLRDTDWLLFSSARHGGLTVRFTDAAPDLSRNLDLLNEEDSVNHNLDLPHPVNSLTAHGVQKSGQKSRNLDGNNNGHQPEISEELTRALERLGVFPAKYQAVAASGWPDEALIQLAGELLDRFGSGEGAAIFLYRLANQPRPLSVEEREELQRERFRRQAQLYEAGNYEELLK